MTLNNHQVAGIPDAAGRVGQFRWLVPMAGGVGDTGPIGAVSYTISGTFARGDFQSDNLYGIAATDIPSVGSIAPPTVPDQILGGGTGSFSFIVSFPPPYPKPPKLLWWLTKRTLGSGSDWHASTTFMATTLTGNGDTYSWLITPSCVPLP
jgi:hypothetical protein